MKHGGVIRVGEGPPGKQLCGQQRILRVGVGMVILEFQTLIRVPGVTYCMHFFSRMCRAEGGDTDYGSDYGRLRRRFEEMGCQ
jgi:hypothetical protein